MKRSLIILASFLLVACSRETILEEKIPENKIIQEQKMEEPPIEDKYVDDNLIKIGFYLNQGTWEKVEDYTSPFENYTDIDWFNVFYTDLNSLPNYGIKGTWNTYYQNYENIDSYRIGYEIEAKMKDGTEILETILKPRGVYDYSFSDYFYIWVYDDINTNASWYSHLEPEDYVESNLLSSIKLMAVEDLGEKLDGSIHLTVFTYKSEDDFDETGRYRGNSKSTLFIHN